MLLYVDNPNIDKGTYISQWERLLENDLKNTELDESDREVIKNIYNELSEKRNLFNQYGLRPVDILMKQTLENHFNINLQDGGKRKFKIMYTNI